MLTNQSWEERIGYQREWVWRGWQIRYSFLPAKNKNLREPPLIFIHGFGASIEHWRNNIPVFAEDRAVYALDLLGFGASRKAKTQYSAVLWAEQTYDFWRTFINQPVILAGNSIGSLVCLAATFNYPQMTSGLVMLTLPDVSVREDMLPGFLRPLVTAIENIFASEFLIKNLLKFLRKPATISRWAKVAYSDKTAVNDELVAILSQPAYDLDAEKTLYSLSQNVRKVGFALSVKDMLPQITIPMLLVWGLQDKMIPPNQAKAIAALNSRVQLVELENVGHCPHDECPQLFNDILLDWLQRTDGRNPN